MNNFCGIGRLTRDPEIRVSQGGMKVARYTLAINRDYKREGEPDSDFISCITFGNRAEFAEKYLQKGRQIGVVGRIQTGSYEKDGRKIYTTDVVVDKHYFADQRQTQEAAASQPTRQSAFPPAPKAQPSIEDFVPDEEERDLLPF